MNLNIIFQDRDILVVEKPPKVPCQSDKTNDTDLISMLKKPNLRLVHRLDRPVGGIMVYAKNKKSNSNLSRQVSEHKLYKEYLAIVCGEPENSKEELRDYLKKLRTINMSKVVEKDTRGSKEAILEYEVLETIKTGLDGTISLLKITLKTGRHHQIRVQLSHANLPIWGDRKYNKIFMKKKEWTQIALWSHKIGFIHPVNKQFLTFSSLPYDEYPWNIFDMNNLGKDK
ncbi:RNA pseudouridine synthase [Anaerosalibacter bizertensis]|uniref:RNA pseudouridylate synthase n=1 Tax=Anaerosalibacter bizertensis TaxID=932217 RepID=A0A9Q4ADL6_9FIRM|nr:RNA pseudouridine synthase [Anaerosalibacter bizertensis]MBV1818193.1 RNA pseudouridine synthase [Bacteroidales bacterium MSK.15.36]HHV26502.1 RNA pseudouridine synthase [Tissierellia bacterium]MCB5560214.1 RNA pseudouridine synthase [Anaerosalibacter bizertensis]MCG4565427.1 RNA pseudouridine synthase [Anaerosalibacter bizertensis]MCG4582320.1 RNA pseudouridine synthase [Anaerosalibacter bizertensis]